ncbi:trypsin-like peptidase domain-containing protein [Candidatus Nephthysia bennettiae]|uniref:Trypsin-like peptidase domain-containing protein n=1 Tax=Candidatus Nephthysia bennettiae TaxID=3127016 RepID=A0A934KDH4_9BACT|nr:trypsin-like peptidase domain-containing protein [Candidatus Dormibacteraeota bacterium]MBJ7614855.1 trypsin-like peptidase domain-containing protein [Candidatus Dormibacteraeota bacterium]
MLRSVSLKAAIAVLALPMLVAACGEASSAPLTPQNLFATSKPGTVLVLSDFKAHLTVPAAKLDDARLEFLKNKAVELILARQLANDRDAITAWLVDQVLSDPLSYFRPTTDVSQTAVELIGQGSGFVISPDGYVVTNAHVAAPDETELKQQLAANGLKDFVDRDVKDFLNSAGGQPSQALVDKVTKAVTTYDAHYLQITKLDKSFSVEVGAASASGKVSAQDITADVSAAGQQIPGKDVAVLKIERSNMPTVPLGDDSQVNTGDKVYVLGYPAAATFHPVLSEASQVEPTLTSGTVSAKKSASGGWPVLQIDAPITHGNSGGPVFDDHGRVIGIATFGTVDPSNGKEVQGFNFAVPISVAREFINKAGAKPQEGIVSQKYDDAISLYNKQWYSDALTEFQQVNSLSPGHPYVQEYITKSQTAIAQGKDRSNEKYTPFLLVGIPVVLILLGGAVALAVLRGRRARAATPGAGAMPGGYPPGSPGSPQPAGGDAMTSAPSQGWGGPPVVPPAQGPAPGPAQRPPDHGPNDPQIGFQPSPRASSEANSFCANCGNSVAGKAFCERCGKPANPV